MQEAFKPERDHEYSTEDLTQTPGPYFEPLRESKRFSNTYVKSPAYRERGDERGEDRIDSPRVKPMDVIRGLL